MGVKLARPPLKEALLELKWKLDDTERGISVDPAYPLFAGSLFERVKNVFPHPERLPSAELPDEITPHVVKQRFRSSIKGWPLVQVGPGVASLNFTQEYTWEEFLSLANLFYPTLIAAYSGANNQAPPRMQSLLLRYINAVKMTRIQGALLDFVSQYLHTSVQLPTGIIASPKVEGPPISLNLLVAIPLASPKGEGRVRFGTGVSDNDDAFIWEVVIHSKGDDVPSSNEGFDQWLRQAHEVAEAWFFELIEGDLHQEFKGEST